MLWVAVVVSGILWYNVHSRSDLTIPLISSSFCFVQGSLSFSRRANILDVSLGTLTPLLGIGNFPMYHFWSSRLF